MPAETATFLAARVPVLPDPKILATTQDRLAEKKFVASLGIGTAPFADVGEAAALKSAIERIGRPAVLKTRRFGYDGKGQAAIKNGSDPEATWREVGGQPCILEAFVPFEREVSVVAARGQDGAVECYRRDRERASRSHIESVACSGGDLANQAHGRRGALPKPSLRNSAMSACSRSRCLCCATASILVNEIAPRVHNSGHWTLDGASISQFEQHIRAVAGWALGQAGPARPGGNDQSHRRRGRGL